MSDLIAPSRIGPTIVLQSTPFDAPLAAELFLIGRVLFGGVLAFNGLNHFLDVEVMMGYAESKEVPKARFAIVFTGRMLFFGGIGAALDVFPAFSAGAPAVFLLGATPIMHDFWRAPKAFSRNGR